MISRDVCQTEPLRLRRLDSVHGVDRRSANSSSACSASTIRFTGASTASLERSWPSVRRRRVVTEATRRTIKRSGGRPVTCRRKRDPPRLHDARRIASLRLFPMEPSRSSQWPGTGFERHYRYATVRRRAVLGILLMRFDTTLSTTRALRLPTSGPYRRGVSRADADEMGAELLPTL